MSFNCYELEKKVELLQAQVAAYEAMINDLSEKLYLAQVSNKLLTTALDDQ